MKIQPAQFAALKADFFLMAHARPHIAGTLTLRDAWEIFHQVCEDHQSDDTHPWFVTGERKRVLPYTGDHSGGEAFYAAGLNDSHIETALRAIIAS